VVVFIVVVWTAWQTGVIEEVGVVSAGITEGRGGAS
jgi:hypothetical protein